MLDFVQIGTKNEEVKEGGEKIPVVTVYPKFVVSYSEDIMIRGGDFYAVWDESKSMWTTDEFRVRELIDESVIQARDDIRGESRALLTKDFANGKWTEFLKYCKAMPDNWHQLDSSVHFENEKLQKKDYASKKLPYSMGDPSSKCSAYDELMETLYDPLERMKFEWAIGSIFAGDSKRIQKFFVFYGEGGTGKSTVLNIIEELFEGYTTAFNAKSLVKGSSFSLEIFKTNPLVAIDHDGNMSQIEDNSVFNSIVSHEMLNINEKFKSVYAAKIDTTLFLGTNKPVKITDAKSGLIRRLIVIVPTGKKVEFSRYRELMSQIRFELPAIAARCYRVYSELGIDAYEDYRPYEMMDDTNEVYSFMVDSYPDICKEPWVTLKEMWEKYKVWTEESNSKYSYSKRIFKSELKNYFEEFYPQKWMNDKTGGSVYKNIFIGLKKKMFEYDLEEKDHGNKPKPMPMLELDETDSIFDKLMKEQPAQYAGEDGKPTAKWDICKTRLKDLDTTKLHYVRVPENHIVIDFDLKDANGEKSLAKNLREAAKWPKTYGEISQSGNGVHLHYIYTGDPKKLSNVYSDGIEVKVYSGKSSLRRKLTRCNGEDISKLSSGLPLKGEDKKVVDFTGLKNERAIRTLIKKNLKKEIHPGTKPSIDFISHILQQAYDSGMPYDVTDMRPEIMAFANNSTHHALYCIKVVQDMKFKSDEATEITEYSTDDIVFFDVEVFPNLFVVVYKIAGEDHEPVKLINPVAADIEKLCEMKLVGFNNRRYDNHILYARLVGKDNYQLYEESQRLINNSRNATFGQAYGISYTDIYDFCSKKQSLKKWEIELGIHHQELGLPWDQPVDESLWEKVADYCVNDVVATEATWNANQEDFHARELLADLSGLSVNDTTRKHATRIMFGNDKHPQDKFVYTDLSEMFPGYEYKSGKSTYRGENPSEGGYVYSEPGYYQNVALLDIASMHPSSIEALNLFGPYTKRFSEIKNARIAVKHHDKEKAKSYLDGKLLPYLGSEEQMDKLAYALKIIINSIYGYTSAKFDNEFRDPRNIDNIVAKRGALFMIDLKNAVQEKGYTVAHIKTDSIKIPDADDEIIQFVTDFGKRYGYTFEHEATFDKYCLVNDAVYICRVGWGKEHSAGPGEWAATGTQFAVPYIFKTLFSHEPLVFDDFCETKTVTGTSNIFLDMNEELPEGEHDYRFVGRAGQFTPIKKGCGGGILYRFKDDKYYALAGTKGYRWLESEMVRKLGKEDDVDTGYYEALADAAKAAIEQYVPYSEFIK